MEVYRIISLDNCTYCFNKLANLQLIRVLQNPTLLPTSSFTLDFLSGFPSKVFQKLTCTSPATHSTRLPFTVSAGWMILLFLKSRILSFVFLEYPVILPSPGCQPKDLLTLAVLLFCYYIYIAVLSATNESDLFQETNKMKES